MLVQVLKQVCSQSATTYRKENVLVNKVNKMRNTICDIHCRKNTESGPSV